MIILIFPLEEEGDREWVVTAEHQQAVGPTPAWLSEVSDYN